MKLRKYSELQFNEKVAVVGLANQSMQCRLGELGRSREREREREGGR